MSDTSATFSGSKDTANPELRRILFTLCLTEITSWGVLYYAFPMLSARIETDTGWSGRAVAAAFSVGLVISALLGPAVGRHLDRHGPRRLMSAGSALAAGALVLVATAPNLVWFLIAWVVAGVAMSAVLYPPAFAALTRWYGPHRIAALTTLTLVAGLASTIFAPLTSILADRLDWRGTYLVLAGTLAAITIPAHIFGLRLPWPTPEAEPRPGLQSARHIARSAPFLIVTAAMAVSACAAYAAIVDLVPLLRDHDIDPHTAAVALGLGGVGQVLGRSGYRKLTQLLDIRRRLGAVLIAIAAITTVFGLCTSPSGLVLAATAAGTTRGVLTLLQATVVTECWGTVHYGQLSGVLAAPTTLAIALTPWIGAELATALGGYDRVFILLGCLGLPLTVAAVAYLPSRHGKFQSIDRHSPEGLAVDNQTGEMG